MAKYRLCGGLAMMPGRDVALLKRMSAQGWHVVDLNNALLYRFEQGEPHAYDYEIDYERDFSDEAREIFRVGGWEAVACGPGWQILRAEAGTTPLYTDDESRAGTLAASRARMGWTALVCGLVTVALFVLEERFSSQGSELWSWIALIVALVALVGFVCSFLPFVGYTVSLRKARSDQE